MLRKSIALFIIFAFIVSLAGCATGNKQKDLEVQGLKNQVSVLEAQIQNRDEEIATLKDRLAKATDEGKIELSKEKTKKRLVGEVKSRPNIRQIQIALQNAGYNVGAIDGRLGKQTRDAIRAFQKANNLKADGRVGKRTWYLLKEYLYKKVK